jgi:hypothetical protein
MAIVYRVMTVCENYAMMRAKGFAPFCVYVEDLERDYFKIETPNGEADVSRASRDNVRPLVGNSESTKGQDNAKRE